MTLIFFSILVLQLITIALAYHYWEKSSLLVELILASPEGCIMCGDDEFGHETISELGLNRYIEPHDYVPCHLVYIPEEFRPSVSGYDQDLRSP